MEGFLFGLNLLGDAVSEPRLKIMFFDFHPLV